MGQFTVDEARALLDASHMFFNIEGLPESKQELNLNDTFSPCCADGEQVPDEELPVLADLFWRYGNCGILYWVSKRREGQRSNFSDENRFIDFAAAEEQIREEEPNRSKRAYLKKVYTIGGE